MPEAFLIALNRAFELAGRLSTLMNSALAARGLTPSQAHVISFLAERGAVVQRELGEALGCTPRHVTTLVDALEGNGVVRRAAHPTDRRAILVSLTKEGEAMATRFDAERALAARALLSDAPERELEGFIATADRLLARIEGFTSGGATDHHHRG